MTINQSAVDLAYLCTELTKALVDSKIDQIYQYDKKTFGFRFHKPGVGKKELLVLLPYCMYLTTQRPNAPKKQLAMSAYFRKSLKGMFVKNITQPGFTRVLCFELAFNDVTKYVFFELFDKGNIIVCTKKDALFEIEMPAEMQNWSERKIKQNEEYYPEAKVFPNTLTVDTLESLFSDDTTSLSKQLATKLGLGGLYANIICEWSKQDPSLKPEKTQYESILQALQQLFTQKLAPNKILTKDGAVKSILPFGGDNSKELYSSYFDSICTANVGSQIVNAKEKKYQKELQKIESMLQHQQKTQKKLEKNVVEYKEIGNAIRAQFEQIQQALTYAQKVEEGTLTYDEKTAQTFGIVTMDRKTKTMTVTIQ